jgi:hypothetical protein
MCGGCVRRGVGEKHIDSTMAAALSYGYTTAVVEDGAVYACGRGGYGQLGLDSRQDQLLTARVGGAELHGGSPVVMVAAGRYHRAALTADATRGAELHGGSPVVMVAAGRYHRAALTADGGICTCGDGSKGQLGHDDAQEGLGPARLGPEAIGLPSRARGMRQLSHDGGDGRGARLDVRKDRHLRWWTRCSLGDPASSRRPAEIGTA